MSDSQGLLGQYSGQIVPYDFQPGFVCLSFAISLIGTSTTLELVRRRTSHRGVHNLLLLIGASVSMGGIAVWSAHFLGNRAIYMLNGEDAFQIAYSTNLTVVSLLVPIVVHILAFLGVSGRNRIRWWRICLAGLLSGGAICGMHYVANSSIRNYNSQYKVPFVVGSVVIAVSASTAALAVFFVFEATWKNVWWKRLGCAMALAGAVSAMHWCAAVGTSYRLRESQLPGNGVSRQESMVAVICLSIAAAVAMTGSAAYSSWTRKNYASNSQQVVLAAAIFDSKGRIMVNHEGLLPSEVVTGALVLKSNDDVFSTAHPLFHWVFRASRNWNTVCEVLTNMADHIERLSPDGNDTGRARVNLVGDDGLPVEDHDMIMRELFCLAAAALAARTRETLNNAGILWDEIFTTGYSPTPRSWSGSAYGRDNSRARDQSKGNFSVQALAEKGIDPSHLQEYGRGCLMFLVRQVHHSRDADKLEAAGYRFAEVRQVIGGIRSGMQIKGLDLESRLAAMSIYDEKAARLGHGVNLGMFAVRARLDRRGFDVLVRKDARNLLPAVSMSMDQLEIWQMRFLSRHQGMTMLTLIQTLKNTEYASTQERLFASDLRRAVSMLRESLDDIRFDEATLLPRQVQVPCLTGEVITRPSTCTLIAFRLVLPIHAAADSTQYELTPLNFFRLRQFAYDDSLHNFEFSHMVYREMSTEPLDGPKRRGRSSSRGAHRANSSFSRAMGSITQPLPGRRHRRTCTLRQPATGSQEQLSKVPSHPRSDFHTQDDKSFAGEDKMKSVDASLAKEHEEKQKQQSTKHPFHGIMVSREIVVDVQEHGTGEPLGRERHDIRSGPASAAQPDRLYTAIATSQDDTMKSVTQRHFTDDLLSMSVLVDKPMYDRT